MADLRSVPDEPGNRKHQPQTFGQAGSAETASRTRLSPPGLRSGDGLDPNVIAQLSPKRPFDPMVEGQVRRGAANARAVKADADEPVLFNRHQLDIAAVVLHRGSDHGKNALDRGHGDRAGSRCVRARCRVGRFVLRSRHQAPMIRSRSREGETGPNGADGLFRPLASATTRSYPRKAAKPATPKPATPKPPPPLASAST